MVCAVDCTLGTDGSVPMALDYFKAMGGENVRDPTRLVFALDHYVPATSPQTIELHRIMRDFAKRFGITLHEAGEGIGHQLIVETGRALPGGLVVGADSHAVTYGALNCFATGIGSSDLAAIMLCGRIWLRVPDSIRVVLTGQLPSGVYAKDVALALAGLLGADGAAYQALEFTGSGITTLALEDRLVLSNLAVEMGAKNGIFPADEETIAYLKSRTGQAFEPAKLSNRSHRIRMRVTARPWRSRSTHSRRSSHCRIWWIRWWRSRMRPARRYRWFISVPALAEDYATSIRPSQC